MGIRAIDGEHCDYDGKAPDAAIVPDKWGGHFGYFSDPDGYLWKVATQS